MLHNGTGMSLCLFKEGRWFFFLLFLVARGPEAGAVCFKSPLNRRGLIREAAARAARALTEREGGGGGKRRSRLESRS